MQLLLQSVLPNLYLLLINLFKLQVHVYSLLSKLSLFGLSKCRMVFVPNTFCKWLVVPNPADLQNYGHGQSSSGRKLSFFHACHSYDSTLFALRKSSGCPRWKVIGYQLRRSASKCASVHDPHTDECWNDRRLSGSSQKSHA